MEADKKYKDADFGNRVRRLKNARVYQVVIVYSLTIANKLVKHRVIMMAGGDYSYINQTIVTHGVRRILECGLYMEIFTR